MLPLPFPGIGRYSGYRLIPAPEGLQALSTYALSCVILIVVESSEFYSFCLHLALRV